MKFSYTILYVNDVTQSVAFYEKAFGLQKDFIHESGQYAQMDTGSTKLSFASNELALSNLIHGFQQNSLDNQPAGVEIAFTTDDVDAAFNRAVEAGAVSKRFSSYCNSYEKYHVHHSFGSMQRFSAQ